MFKHDEDEDVRRFSLVKRIAIVIVIFVLLCLVYFFISRFGQNKLENGLLRAGKEYYKSPEVLLPEQGGECSVVSLEKLQNMGYIKSTLYDQCDTTETYVKVCKLESGNYHYTPFVKCDSEYDTKFGEWQVGEESDLVANKSNIRFTFMPQVYTNKGKAYYPSNVTDAKKVNTYYASAPTNEYKNKDSATKASKWYTEASGVNYWNNGAYSSTQPSGYPTRGAEGTPITSISLTKPASASYRTIEQVTLYKKYSSAKPYVMDYICYDTKIHGQVTSNVPCESRSTNNYNTTIMIRYTCNGTDVVDKSATCSGGATTDWTTSVCTPSDNTTCETKQGYRYTDRRWQWYTSGTYRKYYPSGASTSAGEITYYTSAPVAGAKQDTSTTPTVYKFYKLVDGVTTSGSWENLSDKYVSEDDMVDLLNKQGFKVNSLSEILKNKDIKYSIRLEYSNRE